MSADYHRVCRTSKSCEDRESWWCCRLGGQGKLSTPFCAVCSCNLQENARLAVCACMQVWALCQKCAQSTPCHQPACKKKSSQLLGTSFTQRPSGSRDPSLAWRAKQSANETPVQSTKLSKGTPGDRQK